MLSSSRRYVANAAECLGGHRFTQPRALALACYTLVFHRTVEARRDSHHVGGAARDRRRGHAVPGVREAQGRGVLRRVGATWGLSLTGSFVAFLLVLVSSLWLLEKFVDRTGLADTKIQLGLNRKSSLSTFQKPP